MTTLQILNHVTKAIFETSFYFLYIIEKVGTDEIKQNEHKDLFFTQAEVAVTRQHTME